MASVKLKFAGRIKRHSEFVARWLKLLTVAIRCILALLQTKETVQSLLRTDRRFKISVLQRYCAGVSQVIASSSYSVKSATELRRTLTIATN